MIVRSASFARGILLLPFLAACAAEDPPGVVVGLMTDMAVGFDVDRLEVTTTIDGAVTRADALSYGQGTLLLPTELPGASLSDGGAIQISVDAFRDHGATLFFKRRAATRAERGRTLFLPLSLDEACVDVPCAVGATCAGGTCVDVFVPPSTLADHDPTWISSAPDACKTPSSGPPSIVLGQGSEGYAPLDEGEVVPIEAGAQGGYHVWLALRVTGLRQMRSRVTVHGRFTEDGAEVPPFTSSLTLRKAGAGQCAVHGIRFQVADGSSVASVRGQPLAIEVELRDPDGASAQASKRVVIAP